MLWDPVTCIICLFLYRHKWWVGNNDDFYWKLVKSELNISNHFIDDSTQSDAKFFKLDQPSVHTIKLESPCT